MARIFLDVKPFQETLHASMCGPASIKILLGYYGIEKTEEELARVAALDKELGINDSSIVKVFENLGFKTTVKNNSSYEDIQNWLEKKVPVMVNWFSRGRQDYPDSAVAEGHYSVVCGLDETDIYLQDPEIGKVRKMNREDFETVWFDFKGKNIQQNELIIKQLIAVYK
jgi:ABC-type bacteriocin/lantibiotic exporter with double-glycine peptidase domain